MAKKDQKHEQERGYHEWTVGDRLRAAREAADLDGKQFAETIGISRDTLRNYERNIFKPKPPVLAAWCLATGFDKEWILTGERPGDDGNGEDVSKNVTLREPRNISRDNPVSPNRVLVLKSVA
jgi:transcriptional regulator with XRE-family HTH domain